MIEMMMFCGQTAAMSVLLHEMQRSIWSDEHSETYVQH